MSTHLTSLLAEHGLSKHAHSLLAATRRTLCIETYATAPEEMNPLQSRMGGVPMVPKGFVWPTWSRSRKGKGEPLAHIATLNLEEVASAVREGEEAGVFTAAAYHGDVLGLLPKRGLLSFWFTVYGEMPWGFEPEDAGSLQIQYLADPSKAVAPAKLPEGALTRSMRKIWPNLEDGLFTNCAIELVPKLTLPTPDWLAEFGDAALADVAQSDAYEQVFEAVRGDASLHRLGGHCDPVQSTMELECELASNGLYCGDGSGYNDPRRAVLEPNAKNWLPLLQVDSDEEGPQWIWGDCGMLYFWLTKQQLAAAKFDRPWGIMQCC